MGRLLYSVRFALLVVLLAGVGFVGCSDDDDDGAQPQLITLADFEGTWAATQYKVTSKDAPEVFLELITLGGSFTFEVDDAGNGTGQAVIPEALGGPLTIPFQGTFALATQDSLTVTFNPEVPPFLTNFTGAFELTGNTLEISDENTTFDFDGDEIEDPALFEGIMVRE